MKTNVFDRDLLESAIDVAKELAEADERPVEVEVEPSDNDLRINLRIYDREATFPETLDFYIKLKENCRDDDGNLLLEIGQLGGNRLQVSRIIRPAHSPR